MKTSDTIGAPTRAYVLVETLTGHEGAVATALRAMPSVTRADIVAGPWAIIATIETGGQRAIEQLVIGAIHGMAEVKRTTTCLAIR